MTPAYYATYTSGHHGARDRIGGLPTHLPLDYPTCDDCNRPLMFLMQIYVDDKDLFDDSWLALQLYECEDCCVQLLIALDKSARLNDAGVGVPLAKADLKISNLGVPYSPEAWGEVVLWQDIAWVRRDDPDPTDDVEQFWDGDDPREEFAHLMEDKLGGCFIWRDEGCTSAKELGAIGQFSTLQATVYLFNDPQEGLHFQYY